MIWILWLCRNSRLIIAARRSDTADRTSHCYQRRGVWGRSQIPHYRQNYATPQGTCAQCWMRQCSTGSPVRRRLKLRTRHAIIGHLGFIAVWVKHGFEPRTCSIHFEWSWSTAVWNWTQLKLPYLLNGQLRINKQHEVPDNFLFFPRLFRSEIKWYWALDDHQRKSQPPRVGFFLS